MDLFKELKKQADDIMKDDKKKEKMGDTIEQALGEAKKHVKDKKTQSTIDTLIKNIDKATSQKKENKNNKK